MQPMKQLWNRELCQIDAPQEGCLSTFSVWSKMASCLPFFMSLLPCCICPPHPLLLPPWLCLHLQLSYRAVMTTSFWPQAGWASGRWRRGTRRGRRRRSQVSKHPTESTFPALPWAQGSAIVMVRLAFSLDSTMCRLLWFIQSGLKSLWNRRNKVLETCLGEFGPCWYDNVCRDWRAMCDTEICHCRNT